MTRYLFGIAAFALVLASMGLVAQGFRRLLLPGWNGAPARLAEVVVALVTAIFTLEVLGVVGWLRLGPVLIAFGAEGFFGWWVGRRAHRGDRVTVPTAEVEQIRQRGPTRLVALVAISIVVADWGARTADALHHGMITPDTLWYHMPFAARFVQLGSITSLHYVDPDPVTVFFPANSELIHSLGILLMGNDVLSPLVNLGWLALGLLAAWCIGRPFGLSAATVTGAALLFATPGLVATQPGGAYDDIVGLALLLSVVALLIHRDSFSGPTELASLGLAGAAAGLALGTKYTMLAPIGALTIAVFALAGHHRRIRQGGLWLGLVLGAGGFWYLRNWATVGNPLPSLHIKLGPISFPSPPVAEATSNVAQYLFDGHAWGRFMLPGLRLSFGPVWPAVLGVAALGLVLSLVAPRTRWIWSLGAVGAVSGLAFLVTPQFLTANGGPYFFPYNVRYVDPALILGLVLLPLCPRLDTRRWRAGLLTLYMAALLVTQLDPTLWPDGLHYASFAVSVSRPDAMVGLLLGLAVLGVGALLVFHRHGSTLRAVSVVVIAVLVVGGGYSVQQSYLGDRYAHRPVPNIDTRAQGIRNARIAVSGFLTQAEYPLYGRDNSNYVQYIGIRGPHGAFAAVRTCPQWRRIIDTGRYDYVFEFSEPSPAARWTSGDPSAHLVARDVLQKLPGAAYPGFVGFSLFRIDGHLDPAACTEDGGGTVG